MNKTIPFLTALFLAPACGGDDPADTEITPDGGIEEEEEEEEEETELEPDAQPEPAAVCGDGIVGDGEVCDGAELDGADCAGLGLTQGTLSCRLDCKAYDVSYCDPDAFDITVDVNQTIPDDAYDGTLESMLCVDIDTGELPALYTNIKMVRATLAIDHSYLGDLVVKLVPPGGEARTMLHRAGRVETMDDGAAGGGSAANLVKTSPIGFRGQTLGPSAETLGAGLIDSKTACLDDGKCVFDASPAPGTFAAGEYPIEGTWKVCVGDAGAADLGTLATVKLGFDWPMPIPQGLQQNVTFASTAIDQIYDGTVDTMTCGQTTFTSDHEVLHFEVMLRAAHPKAGELTIALVDGDGVAYGLMSRPGTTEDATGAAATPGSLANLDPNQFLYFRYGRASSVEPAETVGEGKGEDDTVCPEMLCAFEADHGTSGLVAPVGAIGRPVGATWSVCVGDSTGANPGMIEAAHIVLGQSN